MATDPRTLAEFEAAMDTYELKEQLAAVRRDCDDLDELVDRMRPVVYAAVAVGAEWPFVGEEPMRQLKAAVAAYLVARPASAAATTSEPGASS